MTHLPSDLLHYVCTRCGLVWTETKARPSGQGQYGTCPRCGAKP